MLSLNRWNPFEDVFRFQREVDRLFDQFWTDLPTRTAAPSPWSPTFQVNSDDEGWHIDVPLPGVDPERISLDVTGSTLGIRVNPTDEQNGSQTRYEQTITVPPFLDLDKITATHRHGMLRLTLPLKESVKPRRIEIESAAGETKRLTAAA